jgi:hypothetical protein
MGVSGGIERFFEHEEQAIILEDDCLLHPDFFRFCDELLDCYVDDERIPTYPPRPHSGGRPADFLAGSPYLYDLCCIF